jgi:hypothetical protein
MYDIYADSVQAKINDMKRAFENLYENVLSSDTLKNLVGGATQLINVLNSANGKYLIIAGTIGALTLASNKFKDSMTSFQPTFITNAVSKFKEWETSLNLTAQRTKENIAETKNYISSQNSLGSSTMVARGKLLDLQSSLLVVKAGQIACAIAGEALQAVYSMGLSLAITAVVSGLSNYISNLGKTKSSMEDCKEQSEALANSLKNVKNDNDLISQYKNLSEQLKDTNKTEEERKTINDKIKDIKEQLISSESDYAGILSDENLTLDQQIQKMNQIKKQKLFDESKELDKSMNPQSSMENEAQQLNKLAETYNAEIEWNDVSKSPFFKYKDKSGISHTVWFENSTSLSYKLDIANDSNLDGIAIWRLGLENSDYWSTIKAKLNK